MTTVIQIGNFDALLVEELAEFRGGGEVLVEES